MRALAATFAAALCCAALPAAAQGWEPKRNAELQLLDKVTARVTVVKAAVGQAAPFGTLSIQVRACNARPVGEVPDAAAWMEITDSLRPGVAAFTTVTRAVTLSSNCSSATCFGSHSWAMPWVVSGAMSWARTAAGSSAASKARGSLIWAASGWAAPRPVR